MGTVLSRELRKNLTEAEKTLWGRLRFKQLHGHKFRRQFPIGNYIVDFVCLEKRLIIELDGGQHLEQEAYDSNRDQWLENQGFRILRFWDHDVLKETNVVLETIMNALTPHLNPPPQAPRAGQGGRKRRGSKP